jgi:hypothetical protein
MHKPTEPADGRRARCCMDVFDRMDCTHFRFTGKSYLSGIDKNCDPAQTFQDCSLDPMGGGNFLYPNKIYNFYVITLNVNPHFEGLWLGSTRSWRLTAKEQTRCHQEPIPRRFNLLLQRWLCSRLMRFGKLRRALLSNRTRLLMSL